MMVETTVMTMVMKIREMILMVVVAEGVATVMQDISGEGGKL